jgi:demethylmenaquinone methyltransferase/2-methoxy-6-polyprenyl-1,4-benzoquinol methylase
MFDAIAPRYELVNTVMTFGLDRLWRRRTVRLLELAPSTTVLDLACGTGDFLRSLERSDHRVLGADISPGMLAAARQVRSPLLLADGSRLPLATGSIDGCVSGFALRNFADLAAVLAELARVLRPGGRLALLEVDTPSNAVLRAGNAAWCRLAVPLIGALLSDRDAYRYLPRSYAYLPPRPELLDLVGAAGFGDVAHVPLSGGITQVVTATRAGAVPLRRRRAAHAAVAPSPPAGPAADPPSSPRRPAGATTPRRPDDGLPPGATKERSGA